MSQTNGAGRGCPCPIGKNKNQFCGKTETFGIIHEFRKLYEGELHEIEARGHGLQAKAELQQNWIRDLTEQNEMLVHVVEELEVEATDRVAMLEEKLFNSAQHGNEVMQKYKDFNFAINLDETFQNLVYLQSDVRNLLELIKRARNEGTWNIDGLNFYNIGCEDLFGSPIPDQGITGDERTEKQLKMTQKLQEKERMLKHSQEILDRCPMDAEALSIRLKEKDQELNTLRRSMLDMRNALTIEVAEKHDVILNLRRDVQQLEEKCRQANKQTQFKDDIIKELRKEAKQLKSQINAEKPQSRLLPSKFPGDFLEPLPSFHKCCPYVKDLCPLYGKNQDLITYFKGSKEPSSKYNSGEIIESTVNQNKERLNSLNEKKSAQELPTTSQGKSLSTANPAKQFQIKGQVTLRSKSPSSKPNKNIGAVSSNESISHNVLPQINFFSERSIPEIQPQQRPRSTLTSGTILHEYYGMKEKGDMFGVVESFNEAKQSACASKYVSVKTFVSNLEENVEENTDTKKDIKMKVRMSGNEDCFLKHT